MTNDQNNSSGATTDAVSDENQQEAAFVSKKAYEEVSRDMHKNKQKAKELEASLNELKSQLKAQEEQKLQEQEKWKELYQKRESELEQERRQAQEERTRYMKSVKISALKQELGANIRDEYLSFASLDSITLTDEGMIDRDSVREAANIFRKQHGQLIPQSDNVNITGQAASSQQVVSSVDNSKLSTKELIELYAKTKNKQ